MYISETKDSPEVELSISECKFTIEGNSYFVGINTLYDKIHRWIDNQMPKLECDLEIVLHFGIISSASLKNIIDIIEKLDNFYKTGKKLSIKWICDQDDGDIIDTANDFSEQTEIPFTIVERY